MQRKIVGFSEAGVPIYSDEVIEPYLNLAKAIVKDANKEYGEIYIKMLRARTKGALRELQAEKEELENFYHSGWFESLTNADPDKIIGHIRKKAIEKEKRRIQNKEK